MRARIPTAPMLAGLTLLAAVIYIKRLRISLWKSGTIALSVCAVFACINSLAGRSTPLCLAGLPRAQAAPWFCLRAVICYQCDLLAVCRHRLLSCDAQRAESRSRTKILRRPGMCSGCCRWCSLR